MENCTFYKIIDRKIPGHILDENENICDGVYVTQANEPAAGQDVFHYHMHIYPRWNDRRQRESDEENRKLAVEKIKSVL